jgi:hypothetical protein
MLGPADRIGPRSCPVPTRVGQNGFGHLLEGARGAAGHLLDHLRRVPAEVPFEYLEDAARVLESRVSRRRGPLERADHRLEGLAGARLPLRLPPSRRGVLLAAPRLTGLLALTSVLPGVGLVGPHESIVGPLRDVLLVVDEPREDALQILGILEVLPHQGCGVGVVDQVLPKE